MDKKIFVMIALFILVNALFAQSYIISESYSFEEKTKVDIFEKILDKTGKVLISFFSIKQVGIVSAETVCEESVGGNYCISAESDADCQGTGLGGFVGECRKGCCIGNEGQTCDVRSPKRACEEEGGIWDADETCETVTQCQRGCCDLGNENIPLFTTEKNCELEASRFGVNMPQMDYTLGMIECLTSQMTIEAIEEFSEDLGACVTENDYEKNGCEMKSESNCNGEFHKGLLCTNPILETECEPTENTRCIENGPNRGKIFFLDSCNQEVNIYDADKTFDKNPGYWKKIISPTDSDICNLKGADDKKCGNCDVNAGSICKLDSDAEVGDYACSTLDCPEAPVAIDPFGEVLAKEDKNNGDSWCIYDSVIGAIEGPYGKISSDPPGSDNWIASCSMGEVTYELAGENRNVLCVETNTYEESTDKTIHQTIRYPNPTLRCLNYNNVEGEIKNNEQQNNVIGNCTQDHFCQIIYTDVDDYFDFATCVPKYPKGFKLRDLTEEDEDNYQKMCGIANVTCTVVHEHRPGGSKWYNKDCLRPEFVEKMNNLCVSLGDCGTYVNYIGVGTENIGVSGSDWDANTIFGNDFFPAIESLQKIKELTQDNSEASYLASQNGRRINLFGEDSEEKTDLTPEELEEIITELNNEIANDAWGAHHRAHKSDINDEYDWIAVFPPGLVIAGLIEVFEGDVSTYKVTFTCHPWEEPAGGEDCEECNEHPLGLPCTEYKCNSLGQTCELLNKDSEIYRTCQSVEKDGRSPEIIKGELDEDFQFGENENQNYAGFSILAKTPDEAGKRCLKGHDDINFTINTSEYAQCKYAFVDPLSLDLNTYDKMQENYPDEGTYYTDEHLFNIKSDQIGMTTNKITLEEDNVRRVKYYGMRMYIKCIDVSGEPTSLHHVDFCISDEDKIPVLYDDCNLIPEDGAPLKFNATSKSIIFNLNEPAQCSYSKLSDLSYDQMENKMVCSLPNPNNPGTPVAKICVATLDGLELGNNEFYIKCNDSVGNPNEQSLKYSLFVTEEELKIDSIDFEVEYKDDTYSPNENGTITVGNTPQTFGVDVNMTVDFSGGYLETDAECKWKIDGGSWNNFYEQEGTTRTQTIMGQKAGTHKVEVSCEDEAENIASNNSEFTLKIDNEAPILTRFYREGGSLKLVTTEDAICYYTNNPSLGCLFNKESESDSIKKMGTGFSKKHSTSWNIGKAYYIKCYDKWDNVGNSCNLIIKADAFI